MEAVVPMRLASYIDHSVLRPNATEADIVNGAGACIRYRFAAFCVNSLHVATAVRALQGHPDIPVAATVAFPFGSVSTRVKVYEAAEAREAGAGEIDMVANIGAMLDGDWELVTQDIRAVVVVAAGAPVKVILETGFLTREQILRGIAAVVEAGAAYVKNATGYGPKGADLEEIAWIRRVTPAHLGVKAAGGIRTRTQALALVQAGATRIGSSSGPALVAEDSDLPAGERT